MSEARDIRRVGLGAALIALVLLAVLSTALIIHLSWAVTAERNITDVVSTLNTRTAGDVRREIETTFKGAEGAVEIARSMFFQGAVDPEDEAKREFVFLSILRSQPSLSWIGFGFPDGRFFGAHATPTGQIEMVEIGAHVADGARALRRDLYDPLPGDIFFRERIKAQSAYEAKGTPWYRAADTSTGPVWTMVSLLPSGFEPAAVVSTAVEVFGQKRGVLMASISFSSLSSFLSGLDLANAGAAVIASQNGQVIATSSRTGRTMSQLSDYAGPLAQPLRDAAAGLQVGNDGGAVYLAKAPLGSNDWSILTAIPRSAFTAEIDRNARRLIVFVAVLALLAAATATAFAHRLVVLPFRSIRSQLDHVSRFELDDVGYVPSRLVEFDDLSLGLTKMATGLSAFGKYIPTELVRQLLAKGGAPKPVGEVREITVMFADLPGFTTLSEKLGPGIEPFLTTFLTEAIAAVHAEGGTVDKFIGDAVMAFWNAPLETQDHALTACRAAQRLREAMQRVPRPDGSPSAPAVRIGINSGNAIVGNVGSPERLSYTAIGDTVNVASRLESLGKDYGVEIILGEETVRQLCGALACRPLGQAMIRGRKTPLPIFELLPKKICMPEAEVA